MSFPVSARTTGELITASVWNADLKDNLNTLRGGGLAIASQAALDFVYASSATQLARLAAGAALTAPRINAAGTGWEFAAPASVAGADTQVQFNDAGAMAGDSGMVFNKTTNIMTLLGGIKLPGGNSVAVDTSGTTLNLANDGTSTFTMTTGLVYIYDSTNGEDALFLIGNSASRIVSQKAALWATTSAASKNSVEGSAGTITIRNRSGASANFKVITLKVD